MKGPNADNAGSGYAVIYLFIFSLLASLESFWLS